MIANLADAKIKGGKLFWNDAPTGLNLFSKSRFESTDWEQMAACFVKIVATP